MDLIVTIGIGLLGLAVVCAVATASIAAARAAFDGPIDDDEDDEGDDTDIYAPSRNGKSHSNVEEYGP